MSGCELDISTIPASVHGRAELLDSEEDEELLSTLSLPGNKARKVHSETENMEVDQQQQFPAVAPAWAQSLASARS